MENQSRKESRKVQINKNLKISIILDLEVNINAPTFLSSHHRLCLSLSMTSQRRHRCNHAVVPPVHPGRPGRHARVHSQNQRARQAETAQDVRPGHVQLIGGQWQQHRVQVACTLCHSSPSFIFRHFQLNHGKKKKKSTTPSSWLMQNIVLVSCSFQLIAVHSVTIESFFLPSKSKYDTVIKHCIITLLHLLLTEKEIMTV